ncbi:serine/threonine-protein kinase PknK [Sorangium cellulosum]|uniref:serine/threonine-protein kinase n=1 Tax=Sorangium cellulosum TaxID=56 RepID=UPI003D9A7C4D
MAVLHTDVGARAWTWAGASRFHYRALLGRGSLGVVYRAYDEEMGHEVALKTLPDLDPERIYHIKEEFRSLAGITHPNLVELHELFVGEGACFFTMALVHGLHLTEYIWRAAGIAEPPLPGAGLPGHAQDLLMSALGQLTRGISALHRHGKLHRDIKPSNVLVMRDGHVTLLDFDMVACFRPEDLRDGDFGSFAGTPDYMAPEQVWGDRLSPAADWYSVGVLLFEALSGRLPFEGSFEEVLYEKQHGAFPPLRELAPGTSVEIEALVHALLHPDPARRGGAQEILDALRVSSPPSITLREEWTAPTAAPPFVGRTAETAVLRAALEEVRRGRPAVVRVEGASGMGKTELVRRFVRSLSASERALVLRGVCHPQEFVPYKAFDGIIDELSRYLVTLPPGRAEEVVPANASTLTRLFPVLGRVPALARPGDGDGALDPHELRLRALGALRELLQHLGQQHRLVLWIDDVQWGDVDSIPLFRELLRTEDAPAMLLLLSYRCEDVEHSHLLRALQANADLAPERVFTIQVGPLPASERAELVAQLLASAQLPGALIPEIVEESAGSPLFLTEMVRHFAESPRCAAAYAPDGARLAQVLKHRFERLDESARRIIEIVAVAGRPVDRGLVLRAAGLCEAGRITVSRLTQAHLLRAAELGDRPAVVSYHDRIREAVLAELTPEGLRRCHQQIADALLSQPSPDPEALVEHLLGAGSTLEAGAFAVAAAERAETALAFDRAAERYRLALCFTPDGPERRKLRIKLAESLANAGRARESAENFEMAVEEMRAAPPGRGPEWEAERLELLRCAAEQYLRSGHLESGVAALREVLREVGVEYPASPWRAWTSMLVQRARLELRGLDVRTRDARLVSRKQLACMDACWSAGIGLAWVDRIRTAVFQAKFTLLALEAGEPGRIARALAVEASQLACVGGAAKQRRSEGVIVTARRLAEQSGDPRGIAFTLLMEGTIAFYDARWKDARELCARAERLLRERCRAIAWELTTSRLLSLASLANLGEMAELSRALPPLLDEASDQGDRLAAASLATGLPNMIWLAADAPYEARRHADASMALWRHGDFQFQHYLDLIARTQVDLYEGDGWAAWERITGAWPRLRASFNLLVQNFRITLLHLRARAALAAAAPGSAPARGLRGWLWRAERDRLLRAAERDALRLEGEEARWAAALAAALHGAIAAARGHPGEAALLLERAAARFDQLDMALYAAAARFQQGSLTTGDAGRRLIDQGERWMRAQGIVRPARLAATLIPGPPG